MAILKFNIVYDRKHATEEGKPGSVEIRFSLSHKQKYFATGIRTSGTITKTRSSAVPTKTN